MKSKNTDIQPLAHDFDYGWSLKSDGEEKAEIGERIRRFRRTRGDFTLDQLSKLTELLDPLGKGISRVSLSRYETGAAFPGVREIKLLARSLRLTLASLLYGDSDDPMDYEMPTIEEVIERTVIGVLTERGLLKDGSPVTRRDGGYDELVASVKAGSVD